MIMDYVIFDLDGCISNDGWRKHIIDFKTEEISSGRWQEYHTLCYADAPANLDVVKKHAEEGAKIIIITGRPERYRDTTKSWLRKAMIREERLLMRGNDDKRRSADVKEDLLMRFIREQINDKEEMNIVAAYDDRQDIIEMYINIGIKNSEILRIK
jgi:hypothetical protein